MDDVKETKRYSIGEALRAQSALREVAGLAPEMFSVQAFVGMISDEIDAMRGLSYSDAEIAEKICGSSAIAVTGDDIRNFYASRSERGYGPPDRSKEE